LVDFLNFIKQDRFIVLDIETTGLNPRQDSILSVAWKSAHKEGCILGIENLQELLPELLDPTIAKVFHNATFDTSFLRKAGIKIEGPIICSVVLAQMVNENRKLGLDALAIDYLGKDSLKAYHAIVAWCKANGRSEGDYADAPPELLRAYNLEDVQNTYDIVKRLVQHIETADKFLKTKFKLREGLSDYCNSEAIPFERSTYLLSNRGIRVNREKVEAAEAESYKFIVEKTEALEVEFAKEILIIREGLRKKHQDRLKTQQGKDRVKLPDINWASGAQVANLLYEVMGLKKFYIGRSETGAYSTKDEHLRMAITKGLPERLQRIIREILLIKKEQKFLGTDASGLLGALEGDFLYPVFKQTSDDKTPGRGTATGRLSSSRNVQNIPPRAREFYIPTNPDNIFVYADYSQLELRLAAHFSEDKKMLEAFRKGEDLHKKTAMAIFKGEEITDKLRKIAKTSNFLKIYRGSPRRHLQQLFKDADIIMSLEEAKEIDRKFFDYYSDYKKFLDNLTRFLVLHKFIYSPSGRIRRLPELHLYAGLQHAKKYYNGPDYAKLYEECKRHNHRNKTDISLYDYVSMKCRHAINQGLNFPAQSLGATICKLAVMKLHAMGYDVVNNIHDSVIIELPKTDYKRHLEPIKKALEGIYKIKVPLIVEMKVLNSFSEKDAYAEP
jgi:DNA polymerase I-like protein with 3'-5' exonuclease and polymerase domains